MSELYHSQCIPSPLLRRKTFFLWPPMASPLIILLPNLALASLLSLGPFKTSFPTTKPLLLDVLSNFLSLINVLFCHKLLPARLPMLFRPPNSIISTPVSSETVRRVLRKNSFKAVVKKKKPLLSVMLIISTHVLCSCFQF